MVLEAVWLDRKGSQKLFLTVAMGLGGIEEVCKPEVLIGY